MVLGEGFVYESRMNYSAVYELEDLEGGPAVAWKVFKSAPPGCRVQAGYLCGPCSVLRTFGKESCAKMMNRHFNTHSNTSNTQQAYNA